MDESEHLSPPHLDDQSRSGASPLAHEPEDDAPVPALEPAADARVRALLSAAAETGPMPADVVHRIDTALADEARLRVDPGPLATTGGPALPDMSGTGGSTVVPMAGRRQRRPWAAVAAVAAAAAVVAVAASALHVTQRPNPSAVVVGDTTSASPTVRATTTPTEPGVPHIQLSTTDYDAGTLPAKARDLLDHPGTPLPDLAAEAPSLGPIATPVGLASCLDALAVGPGEVTVDLATFDGAPAAIIVVTDAGASTAYAVGRACAPGNVTALAGATPVP